MFQAHILTLFPEIFPGPLDTSCVGKARQRGIWNLTCHNLRQFTTDGRVDDTPAGGGAGMVMRADVLARAIDTVRALNDLPLIYFTPRGQPLNQEIIKTFSRGPGLIALCGRFEGIDERILMRRPFITLSLGDFILSGGEVAAIAMLEAIIRLLPGVLGNKDSYQDESFEHHLLEYPHYTRPHSFEGIDIPEILRSGHHAHIQKWRLRQAEDITQKERPDLWRKYIEDSSSMLKKSMVED